MRVRVRVREGLSEDKGEGSVRGRVRKGLGEGEDEGGAQCWPVDLIMLYRPHLINVNDSCSTCLFCMYMQECENLTKENAAITGHQNLRQKIQYHAATKLENTKLKEVGVFSVSTEGWLSLISRPCPPFCQYYRWRL